MGQPKTERRIRNKKRGEIEITKIQRGKSFGAVMPLRISGDELDHLVDVLVETRRSVARVTPQSLAPVLTRAIEVFGNSEKATRWLERPNRALAQKTPVQMLGSEEGRKEVRELLGRIEYGVYS